MSYEHKIEKDHVIEFLVVDIWQKQKTRYREWRIDVLTSQIDYVVKHRDNKESIIRCRKWLFENHLELFL
jgi:hypothetical protein